MICQEREKKNHFFFFFNILKSSCKEWLKESIHSIGDFEAFLSWGTWFYILKFTGGTEDQCKEKIKQGPLGGTEHPTSA